MVNRKPGSATFSGVRLTPTLAPSGAQFDRLQLGVRLQRRKGLIRIHVRVVGDRRAPILPFPEQSEAQRDPYSGAGGEDPDYARRKVPKADSG